MDRRGFSLVELLVAIAIITILATCLLAGFPAAKRWALGGRCAAHLRELSVATLLYTQDNDETFPSSGQSTFHQQQGIWFNYRDLILPYLDLPADSAKTSRVFYCPLDTTFAPTFPSYIFNGGNEYDPALKGLAGKKILSVSQPSATILMVEGAAIYPASWHARRVGVTVFNDAKSYAAFVDGHVDFLSFYFSSGPFSAGVNPPSSYFYRWGD